MTRRLPRPFLLLSLAALAVAAGLACDSATPTAPAGTILTISASPSQIGLNGTSSITVIGRRPDGNPLNQGTEILFSTDLGDISPSVVPVDEDGVARATLRGQGRIGEATVTARLSTSSGGGGEEGGGGTGSVSVAVLIGRTAGTVSLQATPSTVPESGSTVSLLALVRDDQGQPLGGVSVNFSTEVGTLSSGGAFIQTNTQGEARETLSLTEADLNAILSDSFQVTVEAASGGEGIQTDEITIGILRRPVADFQTETNDRTVSFRDTSTGNPTSWQWDFDFTGNFTEDSDSQNPSFTYSADGDYTVVLRVRNTAGESEISKIIIIDTS